MSLFGNTSTNTAAKPLFQLNTSTQSTGGGGGLFGASQAKPNPFGLSTTQNQTQGSSIFGTSQPAQNNTQATKPGTFTFGASQQQNDANQQPQRPLDQTLRFGNASINSQQAAQSLWEEGRGLGVYRSIPAQMEIIKDKWDAATVQSPLRTYLYQHVGDEKEALQYRPDPNYEDENKWEEAVAKRPGPTWVPLLVRGFKEMGLKAQRQVETIGKCNMLLREINTSLELQIDTHNQKVAARLAECKRRQQATSKRTLALAAKVQILRNKGYVMDNAEEELRSRLDKLERDVLDPGLDAREQEIWARMLGIRERAKRLKAEMDKITPEAANEEPVLDENTVKQAKEILEAYETQLRHLHKELQLVQQEYGDWEKLSKGKDADLLRRR
ncbi:Nucleoporin nup44 [Cyphellophora attinorum]|uniref:Nucleoporin nup44 n=1 Tax=Cyphellophora attinorum TaxID=1664694 RepID=A0A0N0NJ20_9EURO|nr:Nucleoporin nup44 [Phialophora attinorum]KPI36481.1 Nucleoporin nup44 [Phialophora attinorum]